MNKKNNVFYKSIIVIRIILILVMIVHILYRINAHAKHPEYSAPSYTNLLVGVYYVIPIAITCILAHIIKRKNKL